MSEHTGHTPTIVTTGKRIPPKGGSGTAPPRETQTTMEQLRQEIKKLQQRITELEFVLTSMGTRLVALEGCVPVAGTLTGLV